MVIPTAPLILSICNSLSPTKIPQTEKLWKWISEDIKNQNVNDEVFHKILL